METTVILLVAIGAANLAVLAAVTTVVLSWMFWGRERVASRAADAAETAAALAKHAHDAAETSRVAAGISAANAAALQNETKKQADRVAAEIERAVQAGKLKRT